MADDTKKKIAELHERRAKRIEELEAAEEEQYVVDLQAREVLEQEHGPTFAVKMPVFQKGFPTRAFLRKPTSPEYKRYTAQIYAAQKNQDAKGVRAAQEMIANAVWVYPLTDEERTAMLGEFPGLLSTIVVQACKLAEGKADEEGKD